MVRYPVFIPCRDRVSPLRELISWLERVGQTEIYLLDNDSTYPPLLEFYRETSYPVAYLGENLGQRAVWNADLFRRLNVTGRFILTDPDIVPSPECPDDAIEVFAAALDRYPEHVKAGFGLRIDDIPDHFPRKARVLEWEIQHWSPELAPGLFDTTIDTTFALYRSDAPFSYGPAIRTGPPYVARHIPWYSDATRLSPEEAYYQERADPAISTWRLGEFTVARDGVAQTATLEAAGPDEAAPEPDEPEDGVGYRNDVLVIVPTRSRPESSVAFAEAFFAHSTRSTLLFALDDDDPIPYPRIDGALYEVNPRMRLVGALNLVAAKYRDEYRYLAFMGDDHRIRTLAWDQLLVEAIDSVPAGIAYGDDLNQGDNLPTAVLMDTEIVRTLGYMVPPDLVHLYKENVWRALGQALGSLRYRADVVIEHLHYTVGKSDTDAVYREANSPESYGRDHAAYERYARVRLPGDVERLRDALTAVEKPTVSPGWLLTASPPPTARAAKPAENDVLVIVPTRSRPEKSVEFAEAFLANSTRSDLIFGLDDDDPEEYPRIPGVLYEVGPRLRVNGTLNLLANKYKDRYSYLAFMGDDHRVRTPGWDQQLVEAIADTPHGMAYGNDLNQGENLPTAVLMNASVVRTLGYMAPPTLTHLFLDNFWLDLGRALGSIRYCDRVILEHLHYTIGKGGADALYLDVNSDAMFTRDAAAYSTYGRERMALDLALLKGNHQRVRLRPRHTDSELRQLYAAPHVHTRWPDHILRVRLTVETAKWFTDAQSVADLSAGDAATIKALDIPRKVIGDFAPGYEITGPIEETIDLIEPVDLFICTETLEHLDDPDRVLRKIREKAKYLVLSTPCGETDDSNVEHYWGWDAGAVNAMLAHAGFQPVIETVLAFHDAGLPYDFQIWGCR